MDLVYTNGSGIPQGLIRPTYFDESFGLNAENTFELHIPKEYHCCGKNSLIYANDSDLGGIVDEISISTFESDISYKGRTWAGVINSKVIEPPKNDDYYDVSGEANSVIAQLIAYLGLDNMFFASKENSGIDINYYQFRYVKAYDGIISMLNEFGAKLIIKKIPQGVLLQAEPIIDYSEDYQENQKNDISITNSYNSVNHLICLGQGELADRAVIHLFTNKNGGIMKYANTDKPMQDSDYILDKSKQRLFGIDEVTSVYDYSGAEITYNYIPLQTQPKKWDKNFTKYFVEDEEGYRQLEEETEETYTALSSAPSNWKSNYSKYFTQYQGGYKTVEGIEASEYSPVVIKPKGWAKKYEEYYEYESDGVEGQYKRVSGVTKYKYVMQTEEPTDWNTDFSDYFYKNKKGKYKSVKAHGAPPFEKNKYYKKKSNGRYEELEIAPTDWKTNYSKYYYKKNSSYNKVEGVGAPKWKAKKYYTKQSYSVAPLFISKYFYKLKTWTVAPTFEAGMYFKKSEEIVVPPFVKNKYFKEVKDRYAVLVKEAIEHLRELRSKQEINLSLDENINYEIGDVVGAELSEYNISAKQPIISKRISFNSDLRIFEKNFNVGEFKE